MKITVCKEVDMTEEQQEIYDKGFEDGVNSVKESRLSLIFILVLIAIFVIAGFIRDAMM